MRLDTNEISVVQLDNILKQLRNQWLIIYFYQHELIATITIDKSAYWRQIP
jgi:hypothetical protein